MSFLTKLLRNSGAVNPRPARIRIMDGVLGYSSKHKFSVGSLIHCPDHDLGLQLTPVRDVYQKGQKASIDPCVATSSIRFCAIHTCSMSLLGLVSVLCGPVNYSCSRNISTTLLVHHFHERTACLNLKLQKLYNGSVVILVRAIYLPHICLLTTMCMPRKGPTKTRA